jgi:hypothetical protein
VNDSTPTGNPGRSGKEKPLQRTLIFAFCLLAGTLAQAETIQFIGPTTTVNDGSSYVLPYEISINGVSQIVVCFDSLDDVYDGDTWTSSILNLGAAAASGFFPGVSNALADYEKVAWLFAQTYNNADQQIGLQYAIWSVFGSAPQTADSLAYLAAANTAAASGYEGFDFSGFMFIQQPGAVAGSPGVEQAFVFNSTAAFDSGDVAADPEPATLLLFASGLVAGFWLLRRRRKSGADLIQ